MSKLVHMCDYCNGIFTEDVIAEHEEKCIANPKNMACATCRHCLVQSDGNASANRYYCCYTGIPNSACQRQVLPTGCCAYFTK